MAQSALYIPTVQVLKGNSNIIETNNNSLFKEPKQQPTHYKNAVMASNNNGANKKINIEIINMISYIEQTMKTLKNFGEQLKIQLDTNLIQ